MAQPVNPYVAGAPTYAGKGFFGRQETLEWVAQKIRNPANSSLVLFGQRRIGKTSLLHQLQRSLADGDFLPIYFDLGNQAARPLSEVLIDLANAIVEQVNLPPPDPSVFDDRGLFFGRTLLPQICEALGNSRRLVLLLDEFDVLDETHEAELPATAAIHSFLRVIRRFITQDTYPAFIFAAGRRVDDLALDYTATYKASPVREVWVLDSKSAEAMVRQAEVNNTLRFTSQAIARILSLTNGHPYLTQVLCQQVWERAHRRKRTTPPRIGVPEVEAATHGTLKAVDQTLTWLWEGLSLSERIYAAGLAETAEEGEIISEKRGLWTLTDHAARLCTREVEIAAPRDLVRRRVLELTDEQEHRFAIEILRRWIREHKPLRKVKSELDHTDPLADEMFNIGQEFLRRNQWKTAVRYFRDALAANPQHFQARLRLGETLLQLGRTDEATAELEWAYEQDRQEARLLLTRALAVQANRKKAIGLENEALQIAERVLLISPDNSAAHKIRDTILVRRWQVEAQSHEQAGGWTKAAAAYEQLMAHSSEQETQERWAMAFERCQEEQSLARLFSQGQGALEGKRWKQAQKAFAEIVYRRPDYGTGKQLAAWLLLRAVRQKPLSTYTRLIPVFAAVIILTVIAGVWYYLPFRENLAAPPVKLTPEWEHVRTYRLDTNRDSERDWVVLYRFDLPAEAEHGVVPIAGAVYQPNEDTSTPARYDLLPRNGEYLCECECVATMEDVLSGLPGSELVIGDYCDDKLTRVSIFHWEPAENSYVPRGHFSGSQIKIAQDELTVYQRLPHRAQLALRQVYQPRNAKIYYPLGDLGDPVMAARYELTFYESEPKDVMRSPYPEKVVLAFYGHYGDERSMSEYFSRRGWKDIEQCRSGQCGCIATPNEIAHVWVTDLQFGEYASSDRASFDLEIICERKGYAGNHALEKEISVRWNLVQEDERWKLDYAELMPVE